MRDEQGKSKTNLFYFYYPFFIVFYFLFLETFLDEPAMNNGIGIV